MSAAIAAAGAFGNSLARGFPTSADHRDMVRDSPEPSAASLMTVRASPEPSMASLSILEEQSTAEPRLPVPELSNNAEDTALEASARVGEVAITTTLDATEEQPAPAEVASSTQPVAADDASDAELDITPTDTCPHHDDSIGAVAETPSKLYEAAEADVHKAASVSSPGDAPAPVEAEAVVGALEGEFDALRESAESEAELVVSSVDGVSDARVALAEETCSEISSTTEEAVAMAAAVATNVECEANAVVGDGAVSASKEALPEAV